MHELADAIEDLRLVRLHATDEVPAESIAVLRVLPLQVLCAVLPDDCNTGLDECSHVGELDVLRGGDDRDAVSDLAPNALVVPANDLSRRSRSLPGVP